MVTYNIVCGDGEGGMLVASGLTRKAAIELAKNKVQKDPEACARGILLLKAKGIAIPVNP